MERYESRARMLRSIGLAFLLMLLWAGSAQAQTHPCDVPVPTTPQKNPISLVLCWSGLDIDNAPINPGSVTVRITVDGAQQPAVPLPAPHAAGLNASGDRAYIFQNVYPKGSRTVSFQIITPDGNAVSTPFTFSVSGAAPKPPRGTVFGS